MIPESTGANPPGEQPGTRATQSAVRRAQVLRHPDLARRLTEPPLNLRRPEDWTGYIPPAAEPEAACPRCTADPGRGGCRNPLHTRRVNDSPCRAALVAIMDEVRRREQAEGPA